MGYRREVLDKLGPVLSTGLQTLPDAVRDDLLELHRAENTATAKRLLHTAGLANFRMTCLRALGISENLLRDLAITDIAIATTCTETVATTYLKIGDMLTDRTPKIAEAFLAGDLDYRRVAALATTLDDIEARTIAGIEDELLAAARTLTPGPLQREAERLLIAHDPDLAAQRHDVGKARRRTRRRNAPFGMAWFEAFLTADEAINLEAMIKEVADTVCRHDPRTAGQRRADAFLALTRGQRAIACRCARSDCPHSDEISHTPRNKPHVYVHADLATLMQLANNPAVLAGYGPICPDYARLLAEDATWQLLIAEGARLAEHWNTLHPDNEGGDNDGEENEGENSEGEGSEGEGSEGEGNEGDRVDVDTVDVDLDLNPDAAPQPGGPAPATEDITDPESTTEAASPDLDLPLDPEYEDYLEQQYAEYLANEKLLDASAELAAGAALPAHATALYGRSRPAPPIPLAAWYRHDHIPFHRSRPVIGDGQIINAIRRHLADHPDAATGIHPDGHGGHTQPPVGALTYRPTAAQKAIVRARDGHCRFPACTRPAATCEIDHMVPFNQKRPRAGGWTIEENLHCLCKHHHQLKTGRLWTIAGLPGAAEVWTSITGLVQITLPAGFRTTIAPPQFHLDRTPLPPIDRPPEQRSERPPPEEPDPREHPGSAEPPPF